MTQLLLFALLVTAVALGATVTFLLSRGRREREAEARLDAERSELQQRDHEIAAIRASIEEMYERQQVGQQTQHAILLQQIERLQHNLSARSRQIEGLQSQIRYETEQREAATNLLRDQMHEAMHSLRAAALRIPQQATLAASSEASEHGRGSAPEDAEGSARSRAVATEPPTHSPTETPDSAAAEPIEALSAPIEIDRAPPSALGETAVPARPVETAGPVASNGTAAPDDAAGSVAPDEAATEEAPESFSWVPVNLSFENKEPPMQQDDLLLLFDEHAPEHVADSSEPPAPPAATAGPEAPPTFAPLDTFFDEAQDESYLAKTQDEAPIAELGDSAPFADAEDVAPFLDLDDFAPFIEAEASSPRAEPDVPTPSAGTDAAAPFAEPEDFAVSAATAGFAPVGAMEDVVPNSATEASTPSAPPEDLAHRQKVFDAADEADAVDEPIKWTFLEVDDPVAELSEREPPPRAPDPLVDLPPASAGGDGVAGERPLASPDAPEHPEDAEDLTVLAMIDPHRAQLLYGAGVRTVDDIARWGRSDARRMAKLMPGVDEEEIMKNWLFAAQSVVFDRYQEELRLRRTGVG